MIAEPPSLGLIHFSGGNSASLDAIVAPMMQVGSVSDMAKWEAEIERIEALLLNVAQADMPVAHRFADGQYCREVFIPAGTFAIGHAHKHSCFDFVMQGRALVVMNGTLKAVTAPCIMVSHPGQRKVGIVLEDMRWATTHPTNEKDIDKLEDMLLIKSASFLRYQDSIKPELLERDRDDYQAAIAELGYSEDQVLSISRNQDDAIDMPAEWIGQVHFLPSRIEGKGMFAGRIFKQGERIVIARMGGKRTPAGRLTNHSARPNASAEVCENGDVFFVATESIPIGIEITLDYRQARTATS